MSVDDWVFPKLEAKPGAWRRFWVLLTALPNFGSDIVRGTPLAGYAQYLRDSSAKRKMLDLQSRAEARSERHALKALQAGNDVRDIPGADVAITSLRRVYEEIEHWGETDFIEQNIYLILERLSTAAMSYTYCSNLEPRLADHLLGVRCREIGEKVAAAWLEHPALQYLNQPFHPQALHYRVDSLDERTCRPAVEAATVTRVPGQLPKFGAPHAGTNPNCFPYVVSYIGPMPPILGQPDENGNPTLVETQCTLNLFDPDWPGSADEANNPAQLWEDVPQPSFERVYQVDSAAAWAALVACYPLELTHDKIREEFTRLTGQRAVYLGVDWDRVRVDYDVVHFTLAAVLECADVGIEINISAQQLSSGMPALAPMYRVVPGSTIWLNL